MRVSSAALFTLTSVTTGVNIGQAIATPIPHPTSGEAPKSVVIPVITTTPANPKPNITPETTTTPQFSQKPATVESPSRNNSPVVVVAVPLNPPETDDSRVIEFSAPGLEPEPTPIKIPVPKPGQSSISRTPPTPPPSTPVKVAASPSVPINLGTQNQNNTSNTNSAVVIRTTVANNSTAVKNPSSTTQNTSTTNNSVTVINTNIANNSNNSNNSLPVTRPNPVNNIDGNLVVPATSVQIRGANSELDQIIRQVIQTQPGGDTSQNQLQKDVTAILDTGLFRNATVTTTTTPQGLQVTFQVEPVIVRTFQLSGAKVLDQKTAFAPLQNLVGKPISPEALKKGVETVNQWYRDQGYSLARVISITPTPGGTLTMNVTEGVVGQINFRFVDEEGRDVDSKGKPLTGRTKPDFLRKQLKLKPGDVFQESIVRQDLQKLYTIGLFESVNVRLDGDNSKTDITYELRETGARSINLGGNYNADQGIMGTFSYQDRNVGGVNDTLGVNVQLGRRDLLFDTVFRSPYRANEPNRIGYTIRTFRNRGLSNTFDGDVKLANGDRVREGKIGASVSLERPIDGWDTSLGFNYTRVSTRDRDGNIVPTDELGNKLTLSNTGIDDLFTVSFAAVKDRRDNPFFPTSGSILKLSTEQSVPFANGDISMNRLQANYTQYTPVAIFKSDQPQVFALNLQAGTVLGDLPPYEAFNLGGTNSVRGFGSGDIGSGRSYVLASAEYRFPIMSALGGVLFADFASDLGSGDTVVGNPAGVRGKPGTGFGYGAGVRVNSPLGVIRADYGFGSEGDSRFHFGLGQNF